jgi:hypothetical protein
LNEKGGKIMRKRQGKKSPYILGLLALAAFALSLQLGTVGALAQDADKDGFAETTAITLPIGLRLAAYPTLTSLPLCGGSIPRDKCIEDTAIENTPKDLFVIIQRATGCPASRTCSDPCSPTYVGAGDIPGFPYDANNLDPLALVRAGLGVTTHELIPGSGYTSSQAIGDYFAVKVVEDLNPCSSLMGFSTFGSFDGSYTYTGGVATVWPEKIKNWIATACSQACFTDKTGTISCYTPNSSGVNSFYCRNANSTTSVNMKVTPPAVPDLSKLNGEFIQNIINHEVSHLIHLASASGTVDHHYPIAQGVLMEQFIGTKATKNRNNDIVVILYISTTYTRDDTVQFLLEKP